MKNYLSFSRYAITHPCTGQSQKKKNQTKSNIIPNLSQSSFIGWYIATSQQVPNAKSAVRTKLPNTIAFFFLVSTIRLIYISHAITSIRNFILQSLHCFFGCFSKLFAKPRNVNLARFSQNLFRFLYVFFGQFYIRIGNCFHNYYSKLLYYCFAVVNPICHCPAYFALKFRRINLMLDKFYIFFGGWDFGEFLIFKFNCNHSLPKLPNTNMDCQINF